METTTDTLPPPVAFDIEGDRALLFKSLIKAQGNYKPALKSATNPHFRSRYADLADVMGATVEALNGSGYAPFWVPATLGEGLHRLTFVLAHESGGHISASLDFPASNNVQELKSAFTYRRRILCECVMGVAPEDDDDGNDAASGSRERPPEPRRQPPEPKRQEKARDPEPRSAVKAAPAPVAPQAAVSEPKAPQAAGPPPAKPPQAAPEKPGDGLRLEARDLIKALGYEGRFSDRFEFLTGKRSWQELDLEQQRSLISAFRAEKRMKDSLVSLGYDGEDGLNRIADALGEESGFSTIALMTDEMIASVQGQLDREASMRDIRIDGAA